jgi:hypothetical protein|tara:strand:- start:85 stop:507 length:423 start_codon:yes stop_codon:yes gene_type:complete
MTPFDFLKLVHNKNVKWEDLNKEEQKGWNTFIINRALSFNSNYLDIVNNIQPYTSGQLTSADIFKYYQDMLPTNFRFQKWIKGKKEKKYNPQLLALLSGYFECSCKQAEDYLNVMKKKDIKTLLTSIGLQEGEIKKLIKK